VIPIRIVGSALLVLWMREPDPVSADPARATLARLGTPVPGAMLSSGLTVDWPRCGTDGACITSGRVYQLPSGLTLDTAVRDLQVRATRGRLAGGAGDPGCADLSHAGQMAVDVAPGPDGPGCALGWTLPDQPNQQLAVNIMFGDSTPLTPQPGEDWTKYAGRTVSQVVIDVTNIRPGTN
jgi:hypothetical protein